MPAKKFSKAPRFLLKNVDVTFLKVPFHIDEVLLSFTPTFRALDFS